MNELSVSEVLRKAVDVLAERGWHQGDWDGPHGERCMVGAIHDALGGRMGSEPDCRAVVGSLEKFLGCVTTLTRWNDEPSRTYEDVVLAFKRAAVAAEAL